MKRKDNMEYKLIIIVREDLRLSPGKLAVQVAHAAVSCAMKARISEKRIFKNWIKEGQRKVVLAVKDITELEKLERESRSSGFIVEKISDAGLTEIPPGTTTCIGIGPGKGAEIDRITGDLKLA